MMDYWEKNGLIKPKQHVVCAACKIGDVILCGARHWDKVMRAQYKAMRLENNDKKEEQGFIDQFGEFLTREEALKIVKANGQKFDPERNVHETELFSEGLY